MLGQVLHASFEGKEAESKQTHQLIIIQIQSTKKHMPQLDCKIYHLFHAYGKQWSVPGLFVH